MIDPHDQSTISAHYRALVLNHGPTPAATQASAEGQRFRFEKLLEIGDLAGKHVLDLGCGIGDLHDLLLRRHPGARYTGMDIVPEMIEQARKLHPQAEFICRDVLRDGVSATYDVVLMSGLFNNRRVGGGQTFLREMVDIAFGACRQALGFNFISTYVNSRDDDMDYHDPAVVLTHCIDRLSRKVNVHHHYERCDVAMFVYR